MLNIAKKVFLISFIDCYYFTYKSDALVYTNTTFRIDPWGRVFFVCGIVEVGMQREKNQNTKCALFLFFFEKCFSRSGEE